MLASAEARWFWRDVLPPGLEAWFRSGRIPPGGGQARTDEYLLDPGQRELGVKLRGGGRGVEIKGLLEIREALPSPLDTRVQVWAKWTSATLVIDYLPRLAIHKERWLRKYDLTGPAVCELALDAREQLRDPAVRRPDQGCHVELVALRVGDEAARWWSLGLEAFGPLAVLEEGLLRCVAHLPPLPPDALTGGTDMSYPEWLDTHARASDR